jgi:hypothetical protein
MNEGVGDHAGIRAPTLLFYFPVMLTLEVLGITLGPQHPEGLASTMARLRDNPPPLLLAETLGRVTLAILTVWVIGLGRNLATAGD